MKVCYANNTNLRNKRNRLKGKISVALFGVATDMDKYIHCLLILSFGIWSRGSSDVHRDRERRRRRRAGRCVVFLRTRLNVLLRI